MKEYWYKNKICDQLQNFIPMFFTDVQSRASEKCEKQIECSIIISSSLSTF